MAKLEKNSVGMFVIHVLIIFFVLSCLIPLLHVIAVSLNEGLDSQKGGITIWPRKFTLENYERTLGDRGIYRSLLITLFRTSLGTLLTLFLNAAYAYALSKRRLIWRHFFVLWALVPMYFSAGIIPFYLFLRALGLLNTIWVYVIPFLYFPFYIIVFTTFFKSVPDEIQEAARVEGAGEWIIFSRIVLPLSKPVISTIALFVGVWHWNDWFVGSAYVFGRNLWTAQTLLLYIIQSADITQYLEMDILLMQLMSEVTTTPEAMKMAMIVIVSLPIVILYPFLQKHFVKGVVVGSLKG
jgi:putative aldouronate transport system permease protein